MNSTSPPRYNVVFDIDGVLATNSAQGNAEFYEQKGFILTAVITHYIFPGVIEMMQLLFKMPDVRVSFFSNGGQERNELFVEALLKRALGEKHYLEVKGNVKILSGIKLDGSTDSVCPSKQLSYIQEMIYNIGRSANKKSLTKVVGETQNLENCVLIDDRPEYVHYGQEGNYIYAPEMYHDFFTNMQRESKFYTYDENGQQKIPFTDCTYPLEFTKARILNGEYIGLCFEQEKCKLGYTSLDQKKYEEIEISEETHGVLFKAIKQYYEIEGPFKVTPMTKKGVDSSLYALIKKNNGKTTTINLTCNRICYIVGVLFKAFEHAYCGSTLAKFLFPLHFSLSEFGIHYRPLFETEKACHKREEYYHYGLQMLKLVNPEFTFITPKIYQDCSAKERIL